MKKAKGNGLFKLEDLHFMWWDRKFAGAFRWLRNNLRYARQRIRRGYCDQDTWNLYSWFLDVVPEMLQDMRDHGTGYPCSEGPNVSRSITIDAYNRATGENRTATEQEQAGFDQGLANWNKILDRMIFLFHEADEGRCARKNPHEEAYHAASREFEAKYGMFGEKLRKPEDEDGRGHCLYTLGDVDEYKDIFEQYMREEFEIDKYRVECKNEAFKLFSQWFYGLWD